MKKKRGLLFSGYGAWDAYNVGALEKLNLNYDIVVGISTGCLATPIIALKEWEILKSYFLNTERCDIFDLKWHGFFPINESGKLRIAPVIRALLFGNKTLSTSKALRKTIDNRFSEEYFNELRKLNVEVLLGTRNYGETPSKIHYYSNLIEDYEEYKDWMWCGANFPIFGSFVKKSWKDSKGNFHVGTWNGGGLSVFSGLDQLINKDLSEIDIFISKPKLVETLEGNKIDNFIDNVVTTINSANHEIESNNFYSKINMLTYQGVKVRVFWLPRELNNNPLSFNCEDMSEWWDEGYETALDVSRVEIFESKKKSGF